MFRDRKCLKSSGKKACEIMTKIKCLNAEGNYRKKEEATGCVLKGALLMKQDPKHFPWFP